MSKKKNNLKFKKTVDEISDILKEEVKKENEKNKIEQIEKRKNENKKNKLLIYGVLFFTILIVSFWAIDVYSFLQINKNRSKTKNLFETTKQDISDILNTFRDKENTFYKKIDKINTEIEKINTSTETNTEIENETQNEFAEKIINEIKNYSTSTDEVTNENNI